MNIRKERFQQWLQAQKPSRVVGSTTDSATSPIANYVSARIRNTTVRNVGWVAAFNNALATRKSSGVTAKTALAILSKI